MSRRYAKGMLCDHPQYGWGHVLDVDRQFVRVQFQGHARALCIHAEGASPEYKFHKAVPKLFQGDMVRAIRREVGPKTQTRRLIKHSAAFKDYPDKISKEEIKERRNAPLSIPAGQEEQCIKYLLENYDCKAGDIIYVREAWRTFDSMLECSHYDECSCARHNGEYIYRADAPDDEHRFFPSIHMPKSAARIFLLVKSVRVERLQDISAADAIAEGIEEVGEMPAGKLYREYSISTPIGSDNPVLSYKSLWNSINGAGSWEQNPYVWVIEFEHLKDFKNPFQ